MITNVIDYDTILSDSDISIAKRQLSSHDNYGAFVEYAQCNPLIIHTNDINRYNWSEYFDGAINILKDGIELKYTKLTFIKIYFDSYDDYCEMTIHDVVMNFIMWYPLVMVEAEIEPEHIYFEENITAKNIKSYIDINFVIPYKKVIKNILMNNLINDMIRLFSVIDEFSFYFADTINLEDTIDLMEASEEFYDAMHFDVTTVSIDNVKKVGMEKTKTCIDIMKNSKELIGYDHCLADAWKGGAAVSDKQFREFNNSIGTKPDGHGGVYPYIIAKSFSTGGVDNPISYAVESGAGRTAQIMSKLNVATSGHFSRILGLNNQDSHINVYHKEDMRDCHTKNFQIKTIHNETEFKMYILRYYRLNPCGVERMITPQDTHLIGQTIYLRSPMTCASHAKGHGICYKCYGDLAYTNYDISAGKIAAEMLTKIFTQTMLSAKHLLETKIAQFVWSEGFLDFFEIDCNIIRPLELDNYKGYKFIIDMENICLEDNDDVSSLDYADEEGDGDGYSDYTLVYDADVQDNGIERYHEYVTEFIIETPDGTQIPMHSENRDKLYITSELNSIAKKKSYMVDDKIIIPLGALEDKNLFMISIHNDDLSETMEKIKTVINKKDVTSKFDRTTILEEFVKTVIDGNIDITSVHLEVILSNQIRAIDDILQTPDWEIANQASQFLTLDRALTDNPSIMVSLLYQKVSKALYSPLSFKKTKPSVFDLFYTLNPQEYIHNDEIIDASGAKKVVPVHAFEKVISEDDYTKINTNISKKR